MRCWGITDGTAGTVAQVKALGQALGCELLMREMHMKRAALLLPNSCYSQAVHALLPALIDRSKSQPLPFPWPSLIISCGRRAALASLAVRAMVRRTGQRARFIHIQDPQMDPAYFDVVIAMEHDRVQAPNVIKIPYALHSLNAETLQAAGKELLPRIAPYPAPYAAVLLGGSTNKYTLTAEGMQQLIGALKATLDASSHSLLITPSRRTGDANVRLVAEAFKDHPRVWIYGGVGENPYLGMLGLADAIIVTNDSVNMMSEARATGKPVYLLNLPGHEGTKPARLAQRMLSEGAARSLSGKLERFDYPVADEMAALAAEVKRRLGW